MISPAGGLRIYVATRPTDFRKGIDGYGRDSRVEVTRCCFTDGRFIQCDYDAYDKLTKVDRLEGPRTLVRCWAHVRRRFVKRLENDGSPIAEEALRQSISRGQHAQLVIDLLNGSVR